MTMRDEEEEARRPAVVIREYNPKTDRDGTDAVDRECEVGPAGGMSLHADLLGDPVARIRHSPHYLMLVSTCVCVYVYVYCDPIHPYTYTYTYASMRVADTYDVYMYIYVWSCSAAISLICL